MLFVMLFVCLFSVTVDVIMYLNFGSKIILSSMHESTVKVKEVDLI